MFAHTCKRCCLSWCLVKTLSIQVAVRHNFQPAWCSTNKRCRRWGGWKKIHCNALRYTYTTNCKGAIYYQTTHRMTMLYSQNPAMKRLANWWRFTEGANEITNTLRWKSEMCRWTVSWKQKKHISTPITWLVRVLTFDDHAISNVKLQ